MAPCSQVVNSVADLQEGLFDIIDTMVEVFMPLTYFIPLDPIAQEQRSPSDATILIKKGSLDPSQDGRLSALCPPARNGVNRDGSQVGLQAGDHDIFYDGVPVLNEVKGQAFAQGTFTITDCNEKTRTQ